MTIEQLKKEAETLTFDQKGELAAYLIQLRNRNDPKYLAEIRHRIEDKDPSHWLTPDQFEARLNSEK